MSLQAATGIQFSNIPVAAPSPGGLQFAAEGLSVQGVDTVVLGAAPGDPATFFTTERQIDLQGFGLRLIDSVIGGDSFFDVGALQFNTPAGFAQLQALSTNLLIQRNDVGGSFGPVFTLDAAAGTNNGSIAIWQVQSEGVFPDTDGDSVIDTVGGHFKLFNDSEGFQFYFGNSTDPGNVPFFQLESADPSYIGRIVSTVDSKLALLIENTNAGGFAGLKVVSQFDGIVSQALTNTGFADFIAADQLGNPVGQYYADIAGNTVNLRFRGTTTLNFRGLAGTSLFQMNQLGVTRFVNDIFVGGLATAPTATVHIAAGSAAAGGAPLKLTAGTNLTTPENGAFEYDGTTLFFTTGGVRRTVNLI
jgi:hypothetical protein